MERGEKAMEKIMDNSRTQISETRSSNIEKKNSSKDQTVVENLEMSWSPFRWWTKSRT
jgi:hypothetical protein